MHAKGKIHMKLKRDKIPATVEALKVRQWLSSWDEVTFDPKVWQTRPAPHFYLFSLKASYLKALTGVYRRSTKGGRSRVKDPNVQRGYEEERSVTIRRFVEFGYPVCEMRGGRRPGIESKDLLKPGWLPTAIIVNILTEGETRNGTKIPSADLARVEERGPGATIHLPNNFSGENWSPSQVYPMEVIDGQHRLWAFEDFNPGDDFELPVVAFHGLDHSWQAYIFWSVNITPKRINRSLAFDLYPLLRQQSWLDKFAGHSIYRETRCQELVEVLWAHAKSPWYQRINMLGEKREAREYKGPTVSQAAWIRSLMASFVKQWNEGGRRMGGLFGAPAAADVALMQWNRPMQAAFLIYAGDALLRSIRSGKFEWAKSLRRGNNLGLYQEDDPAFYGEHSLITTDQGIRGFLSVVNDLCYWQATSRHLSLLDWQWEDVRSNSSRAASDATSEASVTAAIESLRRTQIAGLLDEIADKLASFDWRTSSAPGLAENEKLQKGALRGSAGYKEMRRQLLSHLASQSGTVARSAQGVLKALK